MNCKNSKQQSESGITQNKSPKMNICLVCGKPVTPGIRLCSDKCVKEAI